MAHTLSPAPSAAPFARTDSTPALVQQKQQPLPTTEPLAVDTDCSGNYGVPPIARTEGAKQHNLLSNEPSTSAKAASRSGPSKAKRPEGLKASPAPERRDKGPRSAQQLRLVNRNREL